MQACFTCTSVTSLAADHTAFWESGKDHFQVVKGIQHGIVELKGDIIWVVT